MNAYQTDPEPDYNDPEVLEQLENDAQAAYYYNRGGYHHTHATDYEG